MKPMAAIAKTLSWVREDYALPRPGGHLALVALCCKPNRPAKPQRP